MTITQNQIQSRIKPLYKSQLERYKQNGLKPSIFEGREIIRFPKITHNSLAVCSHVGLSEIWMPSLLLKSGLRFLLSSLIHLCPFSKQRTALNDRHIIKQDTRSFFLPVRFFVFRFLLCRGTKAQPAFFR
jgi:hypothetical protein